MADFVALIWSTCTSGLIYLQPGILNCGENCDSLCLNISFSCGGTHQHQAIKVSSVLSKNSCFLVHLVLMMEYLKWIHSQSSGILRQDYANLPNSTKNTKFNEECYDLWEFNYFQSFGDFATLHLYIFEHGTHCNAVCVL